MNVITHSFVYLLIICRLLNELENLLDRRVANDSEFQISAMMNDDAEVTFGGLASSASCRVTLTFDLLTPKVVPWTTCANLQRIWSIRFQNIVNSEIYLLVVCAAMSTTLVTSLISLLCDTVCVAV